MIKLTKRILGYCINSQGMILQEGKIDVKVVMFDGVILYLRHNEYRYDLNLCFTLV